jgi:hypothetical protein
VALVHWLFLPPQHQLSAIAFFPGGFAMILAAVLLLFVIR